MNISRNTLIAGLPGKHARDYLRQLLKITHNNSGLTAAELPLPPGMRTNVGLLKRLHSEGYVLFDTRNNTWRVSDLGVQLAGARIGNRISKDKALELVMNAVARAHTINAEPAMLVEIRSMHVFGSVLHAEKTEHGDVDMSYTVAKHHANLAIYRQLSPIQQAGLVASFCAKHAISSQHEGAVTDLYAIQVRWINRELSKLSRYLSVADFSDVGMGHITGSSHLAFFAYRASTGDPYQEWAVRAPSDIMKDDVIARIVSDSPQVLGEVIRSTMSIEERWDNNQDGNTTTSSFEL